MALRPEKHCHQSYEHRSSIQTSAVCLCTKNKLTAMSIGVYAHNLNHKKLKQYDCHKFKASLGYVESPRLARVHSKTLKTKPTKQPP